MSSINNMAGHQIRRLNQISVSIFTERVSAAGFDVTPVQFAALCSIETNPGVDQATLAGMIAYDRATIGGVIDRLESKGYVSRVIAEHDRRARSLHLTETGAQQLTKMKPVVEALQVEILCGLSDSERSVFLDLLKKTTRAGNRLSRAPLLAE